MVVGAEAYPRNVGGERGLTLCVDCEVFQVAGVVAVWILPAVLLAVGIEMWAGRFEVRRITLGILVNVNRMLAGRQSVEVGLNPHRALPVPKDRGANAVALGILQFNVRLGGSGK